MGVSLSLLGLSDGRLVSSFDDYSIKITNYSNFNNYSTLIGHTEDTFALAELNNQVLASGSCDNTIMLWNLTTMINKATIKSNQGCINALLSINLNSDNYLISGGETNEIKFWNGSNQLYSIIQNNKSIQALDYLNSFRYLAAGSKDQTVKLIELKNYQFTINATYAYPNVNELAILPTNQNIVTAKGDKSIIIWDSKGFQQIKSLDYTSNVKSFAILPSTESIVAAYADNTIQIWDSKLFQINANINNSSPVQNLVISPFTENIVCNGISGENSVINFWNSKSLQLISTATLANTFISSIAILPSTEKIVTASGEEIKIWDSKTFQSIAPPLLGHTSNILSLVVLPSSENIVSGANFPDNTIKIWSSKSFQLITTLKGHTSGVRALAVMPLSENIVSASNTPTSQTSTPYGSIKVWNSNSFQLIANLNNYVSIDDVQSIAISNATGNIFISTYDKIKMFQIIYNTSLQFISTSNSSFASPVTALAFFQNQYLIIGLSDSSIWKWDIVYFTVPSLFPPGHSKKITALLSINTVPPLLASGSSDKIIFIWDTNFNEINQLNLHKGQINSLTMLSNQSNMVSSSKDTSIVIWKTTLNFTIINNLNQGKRQIESLIELDNGYLAAASDDFSIKILNNSNQYNSVYNLTGHTNNVYALVNLPNRTQMASASKDRSIIVWDIQNNFKIITTLFGHLKSVVSLEVVNISSSNYFLASGSCDRTIIIWNLNTFSKQSVLRNHTDCVNVLNFYKNIYLISGSSDGKLIVWDVRTFTWIQYLNQLSAPILALTTFTSSSNSYLAFGSTNKQIYVYNDQYKIKKTLSGHTGSVDALAIIPSSKYIVSGGGFMDNKIIVWNSTFQLIQTLPGHSNQVTSLAVLPSSENILSASLDKSIKIWDSKTFQNIDTFYFDNPIFALAILPLTENVVSGDGYIIRLWNSKPYKLISSFKGHSGKIRALAVLNSTQNIVSASDDKTIMIWDSEKFSLIYTLIGHTGSVISLAILPSSENIVSGGDFPADNSIKIWNSKKFILIATLTGHTNNINALSIIPLNENIVSASYDQTIKIWDSKSLQLIYSLAYTDSFNALAILDSTKDIISASSDRLINLWSKSEFQLSTILMGHTDAVNDMKFLPNTNLISCSNDSTIRVWDLATMKTSSINIENQSKSFNY